MSPMAGLSRAATCSRETRRTVLAKCEMSTWHWSAWCTDAVRHISEECVTLSDDKIQHVTTPQCKYNYGPKLREYADKISCGRLPRIWRQWLEQFRDLVSNKFQYWTHITRLTEKFFCKHIMSEGVNGCYSYIPKHQLEMTHCSTDWQCIWFDVCNIFSVSNKCMSRHWINHCYSQYSVYILMHSQHPNTLSFPSCFSRKSRPFENCKTSSCSVLLFTSSSQNNPEEMNWIESLTTILLFYRTVNMQAPQNQYSTRYKGNAIKSPRRLRHKYETSCLFVHDRTNRTLWNW